MKTISDLSVIEILLVERISSRMLNNLGPGYFLHAEHSHSDAVKAIDKKKFDVVLLSLSLSDATSTEDLKALIGKYDTLPVVVIVPDNQEDLGKNANQAGALDYILESECESPRLVKRVLRYAIEKHENNAIKQDHKRILNLARTVAKIGSWSWNPKTDTFIPTPTFLKVFDIPEGSGRFSLSGFLKYVHAEDRVKFKRAFESLVLEQESIFLEARLRTTTNDFTDVLIKGARTNDITTGNIIYQGTGQDITELNQTSETLIQKNRFLELSGEIASIGGWEFDLKTKELYWTSATYDIHGKSKEYVPSFDTLLGLYPAEFQSEMLSSFYRALDEKRDIFMEAPIEIDNQTKWLQYFGKLVFEDDQPVKITGIVYDISDNRHQNKKLKLRAMMLDNIVEAAIAIDKDGYIVFWNKSAETMFGYTRSETIGKPLALFDLTEVTPEEMKSILKLLYAGKHVSDEYAMKDRAGRRFPIWGSLSTIMGTNDQPEALLCLARDISEEKQRLKKIEDNEFRFRRLFEFSPVGKGLIDLKTYKWIDANNTLIKLLGYSRNELLDSTMQDITPPEFSKLDLYHLKRLNRHGVFGPYQKEYLKSNGKRLKVIITGFVMNQTVGQKAWVHVLDITELDATTESLRKSEERFRDYVENATDIILTIDDTGRIDYISPNIKKSMGYSEKEITGRRFLDFIHQEDKREALNVIENAMKNADEDLSIIGRIRHKNGNYLYVQSEGKFKLSPTGQKYGIVIARNVDKAHRSELHVRHQNEILKEIAFIQSHVLRRPLANILGLITLNDINVTAPRETAELFGLIQKEAVIMDKVVEDIVNKSSHISNLSNNE